MWWRSTAGALLRRSSLHCHAPIRQVPLQTLTLHPSPTSSQSKWISINPRPFSSATDPGFSFPHGNGVSNEVPSSIPQESSSSSRDLSPTWDFGKEAVDSSLHFDEGKEKIEVEGESLSSLWDETVEGDDTANIFAPEGSKSAAEEPVEVDAEQVESIRSLLQGTLQEPLDTRLEKMELVLSEEFVVRVIETPHVSPENLVGFVKWGLEFNESVKTSRVIELLVRGVANLPDLSKKEVYLLWDLVKGLGKEKGLLTTGILNLVISMFWKLGKAKAGLEVFEKFPEFGCDLDGNSYYLTIQALRTRGKLDEIWSVCEKMIKSGSFPDGEKISEIIALLCKGNKQKEAHLVYSKAKEKKIYPPSSTLDFLIDRLSQKGKTVHKALELLEDYSGESLRYANKSFSSVVRGLCMVKDLKEAKKLLLKMTDSGPPPGSAAFNYVITALSKEGDVEDALALLKVMESRGLRPDVYTYTVIMSGFAKGGLMEEAHKVFSEAKKRHPKLAPATYHILTRGYCKMEEYDKALGCLKEMKEDGVQPNVDEYNKMIQSLCLKALDWRTAEKLLEEMKESGLHLKGTTRSLIAAVKELEEEEDVPAEKAELEAV